MSDDGAGGRKGDSDAGLEARVAELQAELSRRKERVERLEAMVELQRSAIATMQGSVAWQVATRLRHARDRLMSMSPLLTRAWGASGPTLKRLVGRHLPGVSPVDPASRGYDGWLARHQVTDAQLSELRARAATLARPPSFSLFVRVHGVAEPLLERCLESIRSQAWEHWEVCVTDDGSLEPRAREALEVAAAQDPRVRLGPRPGSDDAAAAGRDGLALARGDFIGFLDPRGELAPEALLAVAARLASDPELDVVYSDEDLLDASGKRVEPFFKPEWSPDLLLSMNYLGHLTVARSALVREVSGMRSGPDESQGYDLMLRLSERTTRIGHVPRVLYHGRGRDAPTAEGAASDPALRALEEALARRGLEGKVESPCAGLYGVRYRVRGEPLVSIVMPTRDKPAVLRACVESLEQRTRWARWELIVVDNGSKDRRALAYLEKLARRHRVLRDERPFNWSALNNRAVQEARGEHLLFMNNDMEVIAPDWMEALLEHSQRAEVGAVGARLLYPDGRIQHAGVVVGLGGAAGHAFKHVPRDAREGASLANAVRDVSAVTGACLMTRREVFEQVGGFDERMPIAFNDVDFCLKLREAGYLVVYTPFAELFHHESATRGPRHPPEDEALFRARWTHALLADPFYSPHLTRSREDYTVGE